jgi:1,4-alpha-glucan branching enzyme
MGMAKKSSPVPAMGTSGQAGEPISVELVVRLPQAGEVIVTGDFTKWSKEGVFLSRRGDGNWAVSLRLRPGEYQYRLRVDGEWRDNPDAVRKVPNPYGSENCILVVK